MKTWLFCCLFLPSLLYSQIKVDKAGDGWDLKIDSAIRLLTQYDTAKSELLKAVCSEIHFWNGSYSTNNGVNTIVVAVKDVKLESINNLALVLVHESLHLHLASTDVKISAEKEENLCYRYELETLKKLPDPEPWLVKHVLEQITATQ